MFAAGPQPSFQPRPSPSPAPGLAQNALLWVVLLIICFGLGYPTLNRYDPRVLNPDSDSYYTLVTDGPTAVEGHLRFRVLVPLLARPFYHLAEGRIGTWNPVFFGLLMANSLLTAATAFLLVRIGYVFLGDYSVALLGAAFYLLNFATPNLRLAGLIDSGEGFFLMALVATLSGRWWFLLPVWGILGALAKESFVPFSIAFAGTWYVVSFRRKSAAAGLAYWSAAMALAALTTITVVQYVIAKNLVFPWTFAVSLNSHSNYLENLKDSLLDRNFWYVYVWLLPLGAMGLRKLPGAWVWAAGITTLVAAGLNAYYGGAPGTLGRAMFSIAGPLLSLGVAIVLTRNVKRATAVTRG